MLPISKTNLPRLFLFTTHLPLIYHGLSQLTSLQCHNDVFPKVSQGGKNDDFRKKNIQNDSKYFNRRFWPKISEKMMIS